jgi:hypothetical protein
MDFEVWKMLVDVEVLAEFSFATGFESMRTESTVISQGQ